MRSRRDLMLWCLWIPQNPSGMTYQWILDRLNPLRNLKKTGRWGEKMRLEGQIQKTESRRLWRLQMKLRERMRFNRRHWYHRSLRRNNQARKKLRSQSQLSHSKVRNNKMPKRVTWLANTSSSRRRPWPRRLTNKWTPSSSKHKKQMRFIIPIGMTR